MVRNTATLMLAVRNPILPPRGIDLTFAINAEGLGRKFGEQWAIRDLDLQIMPGEVFGLLGPNGAGKTTTMRLLTALIAPSAGRASVCGYDVVREPNEVRARIGILTEAPGLYGNRSAQQNLELYARLYGLKRPHSDQQIERYLKFLGLWAQRHEPAGILSKGMKQKLSLVRALLHEPPVVVLDEPTSALDAEGAKLVRDFIASLKGEGRTILLCTHNLYEAEQLCDRVAIISGALLRVGTPRDLQLSLYSRQVEVVVASTSQAMSELARRISNMPGVGDVEVEGNRFLISMVDPDEGTPHLVDTLVASGAKILRVAEIEHSLEKAYLDLLAHRNEATPGTQPPVEEAVA
jgi:ABC-2 type transport system ATP-binding protein